MLLETEIVPNTRQSAAPVTDGPHVRAVSWDTFDVRMRSRWVELQSANPSLDSPPFRPEFAELVAAVRPRAELAILESGGEIVGFFPYERGWRDIGYPLGGRLSDKHGVIAPQDLNFSAVDLLAKCGLSGWCFDRLVGGHAAFNPHVRSTCEYLYVDTKDGLESLNNQGKSKQVKRWLQRRKKLTREQGTLRLEFSMTDDAVFDTMQKWKSDQYERTAAADVFSFPWVREVVRRVRQCQETAFAGVLTAMYAGDRLAAVQFGIRSHNVMQGWFTSYNPDLAKYSPGSQMFLMVIEAAPIYGIHRIDMGRGNAGYKSTLSSGSVPIAEGCVSRSWTCHMAHEVWPATRDWLKQSPFQTPVNWVGRATRKFRGRIAFK